MAMPLNIFTVVLVGYLLILEESLLSSRTLAAKPDDPCSTCKLVVKNFNEGLVRTSKGNFGGGNTHWEEKKLGSFAHSETRLLEIMEGLCPDSGSEFRACHQMVEQSENILEAWWFQHYTKGQNTDLHEFLCVENIHGCCPNGTYGPKCSECSGGRTNPCSGNGRCMGEGTRDGTGKCTCNPGYTDTVCNKCADGFYKDESVTDVTVCRKCHASCKSECSGAGAGGCKECAAGWVQTPQGCADENECEDEICEDDEFCTNTEGSYRCSKCNSACVTCTGPSNHVCTSCASRHFLNGTTCLQCHVSCWSTCSDTLPSGCHSCNYGWKWIDGECRDVNECETEGGGKCETDEYCINTLGSYKCSTCHSSCAECKGPGSGGCTKCKSGYVQDSLNSCVDVDECALDNTLSQKCMGPHSKCINTPGSYRCDCESGFVLDDKDECVIPSSKVQQKSKPAASTSSSDTKKSSPKTDKKTSKKKGETVESKMHALDIFQYFAVLATFVLAEVILRSRFFLQCVVVVIFSIYFYWYIGYFEHSFIKK